MYYCDFKWYSIESSRDNSRAYRIVSYAAFLAFALSSSPMPLTCLLASPDQIKSLFGVSALPVQRTSEIPKISYLSLFMSRLSNSNLPTIQCPNVSCSHCQHVIGQLQLFHALSLSLSTRLCLFSSIQFFDSALITQQRMRTFFTPGDVRAGMYFYCNRSWLGFFVFFFFLQTAASALLSV